MFHYVCDNIIPGCNHKDHDKSEDELLSRVAAHLREHHDLDHRDDRVGEALKKTGFTFIRPA